nr:MAG TPA: hypothetical protein [Caudoviricetes sp.]
MFRCSVNVPPNVPLAKTRKPLILLTFFMFSLSNGTLEH